jgi:hypothetical protein
MSSVCYCCPILTKFGLYRQISVEIRYTDLHKNLYGGNRVVRCRWTDEQPAFETYLRSHIKAAFYKIVNDNQPLFAYTALIERSS